MEAATSTSTTDKGQQLSSANYSVDEATVVLGLSRPTLYSLVTIGKAPPSFKIGHRRFFPRQKLHEWMDAEFAKQNGATVTEAL